MLSQKRQWNTNNSAVVAILEMLIAMGVMVSLLSLFYLSISTSFEIYDNPHVDLQAKSNEVMQLLISTPGMSRSGNLTWEQHPASVAQLGLAASKLLSYGNLTVDSTTGNVFVSDHLGREYFVQRNGTVGVDDTCFLAGTQVVMADRSLKAIEKIKVGENVLSYDECSGALISQPVAAVHHHPATAMGSSYLLINYQLRVTPNHQLYSDGKWMCFGSLTVGDTIGSTPIFSIIPIYQKQPTYSLEIASTHSFLVYCSSDPLIVHNDPLFSEIEKDPWVITRKDPYPNAPSSVSFDESYGTSYYTDLFNISLDLVDDLRDAGIWDYVFEVKKRSPYDLLVLDAEKISNLSQISYERARELVGLSASLTMYYQFAVVVETESAVLLDYGHEFSSSLAVASTTRNALIYTPPLLDLPDIAGGKTPDNIHVTPPSYETGTITVYVSLG